MASSPKTDPVGVRKSFRAAGPERILLDESETTYGGSDHYEVASSGCSSRQGREGARGCQQLEIAEPTYYRWRQKYGGMQPEMAKQFKALEKENARLKKMVAEQALDMDILKEAAKGNW